jgi:3-methyladenine DNA glycosylase AlkD
MKDRNREGGAAGRNVRDVLAALARLGNVRTREEMLPRYGIRAKKAFGVPMAAVQRVARSAGRDHRLAGELWATGWYEARLAAAYVEEPERVTPAQMDRWCRDFDNWGICDTVCFVLFDRTPHAFRKVRQWSARREEFVKRAAFALLACLALHDRKAPDAAFARLLPLVERAAADDRNLVRKGVLWALRAVGMRNRALNAAAAASVRRIAASDDPSERSIGKSALRELTSPALRRRLEKKSPGRTTEKGRKS